VKSSWLSLTRVKGKSKNAAKIQKLKENEEKKVYFEGLWYTERVANQYRLFDKMIEDSQK
jgi:hypothetical protein